MLMQMILKNHKRSWKTHASANDLKGFCKISRHFTLAIFLAIQINIIYFQVVYPRIKSKIIYHCKLQLMRWKEIRIHRKRTNSRDSGNNFPQLELVENCGFTSSIKTNHKNTHFFLSKEATEKFAERQPHLCITEEYKKFSRNQKDQSRKSTRSAHHEYRNATNIQREQIEKENSSVACGFCSKLHFVFCCTFMQKTGL